MALKIWICADTIAFPEGGGHCWAYLNWALGLKSLGCEVTWLERIGANRDELEFRQLFTALKRNLAPYGLAGRIAVITAQACPPPFEHPESCIPLEEADQADLLINFNYNLPAEVLRRFRRTALLDIDPGLLQIWLQGNQIRLVDHDMYFTIGETVGTPEALFPDAGRKWLYTPPSVALDWWPVCTAAADTSFRTVTNWWVEEGWGWVVYGEERYDNSKRAGFLPYLDLPRRTAARLELALSLSADERDKRELESLGWRVVSSGVVAGSPWRYQSYVQGARGEFSCAKPSCFKLQNAWISDRTICFLASGKPAVVQYTGPSRFLPDDRGLLRFRTPEEAVSLLAAAESDYSSQCKHARALAETYFDARKVAAGLLSRSLA